MRRLSSAFIALSLVAGASIAAAPALTSASAQHDDDVTVAAPAIRAGTATVDATWNVGAAAGQYSDIRNPTGELNGDIDPQQHATVKENSYGVQSRLTIRAIVVEGNDGERIALVKSDNYLAQDYLLRRVGQLLDEGDSGVSYSNILHAATHNHSSPYYATPSWGVWVFEDVVDLRMFEYQARKMAEAIETAAAGLVPARMGATSVSHSIYKGNIMRAKAADDGTPAGFPNDYGDKELALLRFDDLTDASNPQPLAVWMNWGQHPESNDSYDLITADFLAPLERFVTRDTGANLVFSQGDVGSAEGPYDGWNRGRMEDGTLIAWGHVGHAQTERGARLLADSVIEGYEEIGNGGGTVPFTSDFAVSAVDGWIAGPASHPYPSISNCNSQSTVNGDPGAPVLGLPDCERGGFGQETNPLWENLREHGIPLPAQYNAPAFTGVEENMRLRLQAFRLGDVIIGSCACEAQVDLILNFESRANDVQGDMHDGFDWQSDADTDCDQAEDSSWTCVYASAAANAGRSWTFTDEAYQRWQAQIHNKADGWDSLSNIAFANAEADDVTDILGNFTQEELDAETGYKLAIGVGHAGDYNGYTVSYREYVSYDHYRKALTAYGPHTADYMSTWMTRMALSLKDATYDWEADLLMRDPSAIAREAADEGRQLAGALALGLAAEAEFEAWQAALPNDLGTPTITAQPTDITRFDAATITWVGGNNAVDNPVVTVERLVDGEWIPYADMTGEVQTRMEFPQGVQGLVDYETGSHEWIWHANFEAFVGGPNQDLMTTPVGSYRFVVNGNHRAGGATAAYTMASEEFAVGAWTGVPDSAAHIISSKTYNLAGTRVTFVKIALDSFAYPRSYTSDFRFISDDGKGRIVDADGNPVEDDLRVCETCSFRPWSFSGNVDNVRLRVTRSDGATQTVPTIDLGDGYLYGYIAPVDGDEVIEIATIRDAYGNTN